MATPTEISTVQLPAWAQVAFVILDKYGLGTLLAIVLCGGLIVIIWKWFGKLNENQERQLVLLEKIMDRVGLVLRDHNKEE